MAENIYIKSEFDDDYAFEEDDERTWRREVVIDVATFWTAALALLNTWSEYRSKAKLYFNATHDETRPAVWPVIVKSYNGNLDQLLDHEGELSELVNFKLKTFNDLCDMFEVDTISRQWLYDNLKDRYDYGPLRSKLKRRIKGNNPAQSWRELV